MAGLGRLTADQVQHIEKSLAAYTGEAGLTAVLLVDPDGHLVSHAGNPAGIDAVSFGALVSANFASTQQIAGQMGEEEFDAFFIQGKNASLFIHAVGVVAILVSIFPKATTVGLVKVFAEKTVKILTEIFSAADDETDAGMSVSGGFTDSALAELDKVLGG